MAGLENETRALEMEVGHLREDLTQGSSRWHFVNAMRLTSTVSLEKGAAPSPHKYSSVYRDPLTNPPNHNQPPSR